KHLSPGQRLPPARAAGATGSASAVQGGPPRLGTRPRPLPDEPGQLPEFDPSVGPVPQTGHGFRNRNAKNSFSFASSASYLLARPPSIRRGWTRMVNSSLPRSTSREVPSTPG